MDDLVQLTACNMRHMQPGFLSREELQLKNDGVRESSSLSRAVSPRNYLHENSQESNSHRVHIVKRLNPQHKPNNPERNNSPTEIQPGANRIQVQKSQLESSSWAALGNRQNQMMNLLKTPKRENISINEDSKGNIFNQIQGFGQKNITEKNISSQLDKPFPVLSQTNPIRPNMQEIPPLNKESIKMSHTLPERISEKHPNQGETYEHLKTNFQCLLKLFSPSTRIPEHELKSSIETLFRMQLTSLFGSASQLSSPGQFAMKSSKEIQKDFLVKQKEIQVLHELMESFEYYAQQQQKLHYYNADLKKTLDHIWMYLYDGYQNRFKDYTAHCLERLTPNQSNPYEDPNRLFERIQDLNKTFKSDDQVWQEIKMKGFQETRKKMPEKRKQNVGNNNFDFPGASFIDHLEDERVWVQNDLVIIVRGTKQQKEEKLKPVKRKLIFQSKQKGHLHPGKKKYKIISRFNKIPETAIKDSQFTCSKKNDVVILYDFTIFWKESSSMQIVLQEKFCQINTVTFPGDPTFQSIFEQLFFQFKLDFFPLIKSNAKVEVAKMDFTKQQRQFKVSLAVYQNVIDLPENYSWKVKSWKPNSLIASSLTISNENGQVQWIKDVDLKGLHFTEEQFCIGNQQIDCHLKQLNKPCLVTFFRLPDNLLKARDQKTVKLFEKFVRKMGFVELIKVDFQKNSFTVQFDVFTSDNSKKSKNDSELPETATKSPKL